MLFQYCLQNRWVKAALSVTEVQALLLNGLWDHKDDECREIMLQKMTRQGLKVPKLSLAVSAADVEPGQQATIKVEVTRCHAYSAEEVARSREAIAASMQLSASTPQPEEGQQPEAVEPKEGWWVIAEGIRASKRKDSEQARASPPPLPPPTRLPPSARTSSAPLCYGSDARRPRGATGRGDHAQLARGETGAREHTRRPGDVVRGDLPSAHHARRVQSHDPCARRPPKPPPRLLRLRHAPHAPTVLLVCPCAYQVRSTGCVGVDVRRKLTFEVKQPRRTITPKAPTTPTTAEVTAANDDDVPQLQ